MEKENINKHMDVYQQVIHKSRYARWITDLNRREHWEETPQRYIKFFRERFPDLKVDWDELLGAIINLEAMPSMRAMYTAGKALERDEVAGYNCSYAVVDDPKVFSEIMYILMCGTGVGFSVERQFIQKLPEIAEEFHPTDTTIVVKDSKIGWASAFQELLSLLWQGKIPKWDMSKVRPAGSPLKVFGGRASGPEPLIDLFNFTVNVFQKAKGRKLTSIECHDVITMVASAIVVGGVRRCLPEGTRIQTPTGFVEIQNLKSGDEIETNGKIAKVLGMVPSGKQKTITFVHTFGQLTCTENHRVAIFDKDDPTKHNFVFAKDIEPDDRLVWDSNGYRGKVCSLPSVETSGHFNSKEVKTPQLTEDVAWLIGLIHGDGSIQQRMIEITANSSDKILLEHADKIFFENFGINGSITEDNGDCFRLRVSSKDLSDWMLQHIKKPNADIIIPEFIKSSVSSIRYAYLAGLYDADGRFRKDNVFDQVTSIYVGFSEEVSELLSSLGIGHINSFRSASKRREAKVNTKDFYTITVKGRKNISKWISKISKYSKSNKADFNSYIDKPGNGCDFKYTSRQMGYPNGWKKDGSLALSTCLDLGLISPETSLFPVEIVKIIHNEDEVETYDIEVETLEQFTTDGIVVHNSACISLSNLSDDRMRQAKSGQWWIDNPQRALANNSAVYTEKPDYGIFMQEWMALYESKSGERGIVNRKALQEQALKFGRKHDYEFGLNPCGEIILRPQQFCNLSEVIVRPEDNYETLKKKIRIAVIFGTLQASLVNFRYLRKIWRKNVEEEALLGVSLTGIRDNLWLSTPTEQLKKDLDSLRDYVIEVNKEIAKMIGIEPAKSVTALKPSGTISQLVNASSGIHPRFAEYYIRRIRNNAKDPLSKFLITQGVPYEIDVTNPNTYVFSFYVKSPKGSKTVKDHSAVEQLDFWKIYKEHWTTHNPSVTVYVKEDEWAEVAAWVWKNFDLIGGISFLPYSDHIYKQAPYEEITKEEYENWISNQPDYINWEVLSEFEVEDATTGSHELACAGGACDITSIS